MTLPSLVAFDLDGTVLDSMEELSRAATSLMVKYYGCDEDEALRLYESTTGDPFAAQLQDIFPFHPQNARVTAVFEHLKRLLYRRWYVRPFPEVAGVLASLSHLGVQTALVSSTTTELARYATRDLSFDFVLGLGFGSKVSQLLWLKKESPEVLFIGDSFNDLAYALRAETRFLLVTRTSRAIKRAKALSCVSIGNLYDVMT